MTRIFTLRIFTQFGGLDAGGRTQSDLAKEFNVERTAVTRLNRKKNETISIAESNKDLNQKRQRKTGALVVKISAGLSTGGVLGFHGVGPCSEILGPIPKRKGSFQIGVRKYFGF